VGSFPETFYDPGIENPDNWCPGEFALDFNSDRMKISCIFQLPTKFSKNTILGFWKVRPAKQFFLPINSIQFFKKLELGRFLCYLVPSSWRKQFFDTRDKLYSDGIHTERRTTAYTL